MNDDTPLEVVADRGAGDRLLIYLTDRGTRIELKIEDETFWATQRQMAEAFGVTPQNITLHLKNIFAEGELTEGAVCKESLHTGPDGKRYVVKLYNLNAAISVGYRVGGRLGTHFRIWATDKLFRYLTKGFVIDEAKLKTPNQHDRVAELREIIRDIRSAEANVYAELRRICALCQDYDPASAQAREFYGRMQAKLYWATVSRTPSMIVFERANADAPDMGLKTWAKDHILQADVCTAKNYLDEPELKELNRLTTILLDVFDDQLEIGKLTLMTEADRLLDQQLRNLNRVILRHGGTVSHEDAELRARAEYRTFDAARRAARAQATRDELADLKAATRSLPKTRKRPKDSDA